VDLADPLQQIQDAAPPNVDVGDDQTGAMPFHLADGVLTAERLRDGNSRAAARDRFPHRASKDPMAVNQQYSLKNAHLSPPYCIRRPV
jgi:hypothetical protein